MAFCPECKKEMGMRDVVCPHCGHDFPSIDSAPPTRKGIAYSAIGETALVIGQTLSGLASVLLLFCGIASLFQIELRVAFAYAAGSVLCLALYVVFVRTQHTGCEQGGRGPYLRKSRPAKRPDDSDQTPGTTNTQD